MVNCKIIDLKQLSYWSLRSSSSFYSTKKDMPVSQALVVTGVFNVMTLPLWLSCVCFSPFLLGHGWVQATGVYPIQETKTDIWLLSEGGEWRGGSPDPLLGNGRSSWAGWHERRRPHPPGQWNICRWMFTFWSEQDVEILQCINQINNNS